MQIYNGPVFNLAIGTTMYFDSFGGSVTLTRPTYYSGVRLEADFGLRVTFNGYNYGGVNVPDDFVTKGLCGNNDNNRDNDLPGSVSDHLHQWQVYDPEEPE